MIEDLKWLKRLIIRKVRGMKMQIDTDKMAQQLIDTVNDKIKNLKTLNIIII